MANQPAPGGTVTAVLEVGAPFDGGSQLDFLGRRAVPGIETVCGTSYSRTLRLPHGPATVALDVRGRRIEARFRLAADDDLAAGLLFCRRLLDLDVDSTTVDRHLAADPRLAASVRAHPGLRVPGHVDGFEVAVRAIVGQQISVTGARTILARLVAEHGDVVSIPSASNPVPPDSAPSLTRLFPAPEVLAAVDPSRLPMPRARGRALTSVAAAVAAGEIALDRTVSRAEVRRSLLALPGIGPWTADYIALRALGDPDVFLGTDLGVRHGLARLGITGAGPDATAAWRPWRSYALMHVWKSLDQEGT